MLLKKSHGGEADIEKVTDVPWYIIFQFFDHCKLSVSISKQNEKSTCIQPPPQSLCVYHENLRIELISIMYFIKSWGFFLLPSRSEQEAEHHFIMAHKMIDKLIFLVLTSLN